MFYACFFHLVMLWSLTKTRKNPIKFASQNIKTTLFTLMEISSSSSYRSEMYIFKKFGKCPMGKNFTYFDTQFTKEHFSRWVAKIDWRNALKLRTALHRYIIEGKLAHRPSGGALRRKKCLSSKMSPHKNDATTDTHRGIYREIESNELPRM